MNDERNPYITQAADPIDDRQSHQTQEQQPYQQPAYYQQPQQQPYYQQPQQQPYYQQPPQPQYPAYRQQSYQGYAQPQRGSGIAKAFSIVSFAAGCISLLTLLSSLIRLGEYSYQSAFGMIFVYGIILAIPGLVFGIVALVKKTRLFPLALLGVIFNGLLLLTGIVLLMSTVIFGTIL